MNAATIDYDERIAIIRKVLAMRPVTPAHTGFVLAAQLRQLDALETTHCEALRRSGQSADKAAFAALTFLCEWVEAINAERDG